MVWGPVFRIPNEELASFGSWRQNRQIRTQVDCGLFRQESYKEMTSKKRNPFSYRAYHQPLVAQITSLAAESRIFARSFFIIRLAKFMLNTGTPSLVSKRSLHTHFVSLFSAPPDVRPEYLSLFSTASAEGYCNLTTVQERT